VTSAAAAPRIFDRDHVERVFADYGIGWTKLRTAGIDPAISRRLRSGKGIRTLTPLLRERLTKTFPEATWEIEEAFVTVTEIALYVCAARWRRRRGLGLPDSDSKDIPTLDTLGRLNWVSPTEEPWMKRRNRELAPLRRRIDAVVPSKSMTTVGNSMSAQMQRLVLQEQRALAPLLEWEASGFTERHWLELSADELHRFMTTGARERENVLSERVDDLSRIRVALKKRGPSPVPFNPADVRDSAFATELEEAWADFPTEFRENDD
jgi:hypothetical protein